MNAYMDFMVKLTGCIILTAIPLFCLIFVVCFAVIIWNSIKHKHKLNKEYKQ